MNKNLNKDMKKQYKAPVTEEMVVEAESMLDASVTEVEITEEPILDFDLLQ
jgi:hypothetical protein